MKISMIECNLFSYLLNAANIMGSHQFCQTVMYPFTLFCFENWNVESCIRAGHMGLSCVNNLRSVFQRSFSGLRVFRNSISSLL